MLSSVVSFQHERVFIWKLDASCIPLLIPGMLGAVIEDLDSAKGCKADAMREKVTFEREQVAIGCRVVSIDPAEFDPVPVAHQVPWRYAKVGRRVNRDPVLVLHVPRLRRSKELVTATEEKIVFFVRIDVFPVRRQNRFELIAKRRGCVPLLKGITGPLLQPTKREHAHVRFELNMGITFRPEFRLCGLSRCLRGTGDRHQDQPQNDSRLWASGYHHLPRVQRRSSEGSVKSSGRFGDETLRSHRHAVRHV
jgi:hypothetical protein